MAASAARRSSSSPRARVRTPTRTSPARRSRSNTSPPPRSRYYQPACRTGCWTRWIAHLQEPYVKTVLAGETGQDVSVTAVVADAAQNDEPEAVDAEAGEAFQIVPSLRLEVDLENWAIRAPYGGSTVRKLVDVEIYGELALDGSLRAVPGLLPSVIKARDAERSVIVPESNAAEAALAGAVVYPAASLRDVIDHLAGRSALEPGATEDVSRPLPVLSDLIDVKGQQFAKRALEVAAAGSHNLLLVGPPGTGKTSLGRSIAMALGFAVGKSLR